MNENANQLCASYEPPFLQGDWIVLSRRLVHPDSGELAEGVTDKLLRAPATPVLVHAPVPMSLSDAPPSFPPRTLMWAWPCEVAPPFASWMPVHFFRRATVEELSMELTRVFVHLQELMARHCQLLTDLQAAVLREKCNQ